MALSELNQFPDAAVRYLAEALGTQPEVTTFPAQKELPPYLQQRYALFLLRWEGRRFILAQPRDQAQIKPATLEKDFARLPRDGAEDIGLLADSLPGYLRKRLIDRRIPFVIPEYQLFWPALGVVVREKQGKARPKEVEAFTPAAQVVVLCVLNGRAHPPLSPKPLAEALGYSRMSMGRALDEIVAAEVGSEETRRGRSRQVELPRTRQSLWQKARPFMRSPVQRELVTWERDVATNSRYWAGEFALAKESMLGPPAMPVFAIGPAGWSKLKDQLENLPFGEAGACTLQVWRYEPEVVARDGVVDPFSLWLSLADHPDERVEGALEELLEGQWE